MAPQSREEGIYLVLSPHLDDAVLSCGGLLNQLVERGQPVRVLTCLAGVPDYRVLSPFAADQHRRWGHPKNPVRNRRAEDIAALTSLGVVHEHWPYLDCIYRRAKDSSDFLYTSEESLFAQVASVDHWLVEALARRVRRHFGPNGTVVYAPLSAGAHVDHQIVRLAALRLETSGYCVTYYEDYPYAEHQEQVQMALSRWETPAQELQVVLSEQDLAAKTAAIQLYGSQLEVLFGGEQAVPGRVKSYSLVVGAGRCSAERYYWWVIDS